MRIVVSGGTGFVGRALCHALVRRGDQVSVLTRGPARSVTHACAKCAGGKVELVTWTPDEPGDWMRIVDGVDAVINLAGASIGDERWTPERKALLRSSRITSTTLLARAIAEAERKPKVFVSASAVGHYGVRRGADVLTEDEPCGDDFLAVLTKDWEAAAAPAREAGVRTCHPRLGLVLGRRGGLFAKLAPIFRSFVGGPVGDGEQYVPWIHLHDVVRAIELLVARTDLEGPFNVVAPEPVTMNVFAKALAKALDRPCIFRVPAFAVKLALGSEAAEIVLTGQRAIPRRLVDAGFAFVFPELESALADLVSTTATD